MGNAEKKEAASIERSYQPKELKGSIFTCATGWFWTPDGKLGAIKGILKTRVGYAGGQAKNPSYENMQDHTESIQLEYDTNVISFEQLFEIFLTLHNPCSNAWSVQYSSAFYYNNEAEKLHAEKKFAEVAQRKKKEVNTLLKPYEGLKVAEDYHQKYYFRQNSVLTRLFPLSDEEILDSAIVMKLNSICSEDYEVKGKSLEVILEYFGFGSEKEAPPNLLSAITVLLSEVK